MHCLDLPLNPEASTQSCALKGRVTGRGAGAFRVKRLLAAVMRLVDALCLPVACSLHRLFEACLSQILSLPLSRSPGHRGRSRPPGSKPTRTLFVLLRLSLLLACSLSLSLALSLSLSLACLLACKGCGPHLLCPSFFPSSDPTSGTPRSGPDRGPSSHMSHCPASTRRNNSLRSPMFHSPLYDYTIFLRRSCGLQFSLTT